MTCPNCDFVFEEFLPMADGDYLVCMKCAWLWRVSIDPNVKLLKPSLDEMAAMAKAQPTRLAVLVDTQCRVLAKLICRLRPAKVRN